MPRYRKFLDMDVLTAARKRVEYVLDTHDTPVVMFSGGKDSLVVLNIVLDAARDRGKLPLDVVFRDEELIPDSVIDFVDGWRQRDDITMRWLAYPTENQKFVLGVSMPYIQWDPAREWIRPKPPWADPGNGRTYHQSTMDDTVADFYKGKVALFNGIRADESLMRYRSCVNKLVDNYVCASSCTTASFVKPIYDWSETDIFKYLYDEAIPYCPIYDAQVLSGSKLRVATPLNSENAKRHDQHIQWDPEFYDRLVQIFPEFQLNRYWPEYDKSAIERSYGCSFLGVRRWILANVGGSHRNLALENLGHALRMRATNPRLYHPLQLLQWAMRGGYEKNPLPLKPGEYEKLEQKCTTLSITSNG